GAQEQMLTMLEERQGGVGRVLAEGGGQAVGFGGEAVPERARRGVAAAAGPAEGALVGLEEAGPGGVGEVAAAAVGALEVGLREQAAPDGGEDEGVQCRAGQLEHVAGERGMAGAVLVQKADVRVE